MLPTRLTIFGSIAFATGMLVIGLAVATGGNLSHTAVAGNQSPTRAASTSTTVRRSATPTKTATPEATKTEVPRTAVPTVKPAPTSPSGGTAGENIIAPNTGSGPSGGNATSIWLLALGVMLAVMGSGAVLATVRRRS